MTRSGKIPLSPILDQDLLDSWELSLQAANRSPQSIQTYRESLKAFRVWLSPSSKPEECVTRVADITQEVVQHFIAHLLETRKQGTAATRFRGLQAFFKWCIEDEILSESPLRKLHEPAITDRPPVLILPDEAVSAILAIVKADKTFQGHRDRALLRVLMCTGMRRADCAHLELGDFNLLDRTLAIRRSKGGKGRMTALDPMTAKFLDRYIKRIRIDHPYSHLEAIWLAQKGALTVKGINYVVTHRAEQAGLEHIHPHLFRHLATHEFLARGMQVNNVAELLGHKDLNMIMEVYGRPLANKRAIEEFNRLHIGDRW